MTLRLMVRDLGLVGLTLQGLLTFVLLAKKSWRRFPFFSIYLWSSFAFNVAGYTLARSSITYFYTYWANEALGIALGLLIVYEIFRHLFTVHAALLRLATIIFRIAIVVLLIAGFIVYIMQPANEISSFKLAVKAMEQAARVIEVGLLMILFICSAAFGLHWKQAEFGIAVGLGFFATLELLTITLRPMVGHSGAELHGFLNYLVQCAIAGTPYTIYGYKGKQVRDNIHSFDVISAFEAFAKDPRPGEVYNLGGCRGNSCSMLEAMDAAEALTGKKIQRGYVEQNRKGDHICYISDMQKFRSHYPDWSITKPLAQIYKELVGGHE